MKLRVAGMFSLVALLAGAAFGMSGAVASAGSSHDGHDKAKVIEKSYTTTVPASHPQQEWKAEVTITKKFVYKHGEGLKLISVSKDVTGCFNHQGKSVGGYQNNPNCQPAR